jgi:cellobiose phosphorylase
VSLSDLAQDLARKADWLCAHIGAQEWVTSREGLGWFNGYYDDDGQRVEGDLPQGVRMTLTGQVFTLMSGIATDRQAQLMVRAADRYLFDPGLHGHRLNTDFGEVRLNLGRCFGFAFGHKENGAVFSHMAVMYAYALYQRGLVAEGHKVLDNLYQHCQNFAVSRMYPGLPEYLSPRGRGMYPYLTGSASWYLLTWVTEVFGLRGKLGDLALTPKLVRAQFGPAGQARLKTLFAGQALEVQYDNPARLDFGGYHIESVQLDGADTPFRREAGGIVIARAAFTTLAGDQPHHLVVRLGKRP